MSGLSQEEAFARIRLLRSANVGPISYRALLRRFGSASEALAALPALARRGHGRDYRPASGEEIAAEVERARIAGARYLFHDSPDYPALLAQMESAPPILTYRGRIALARQPCIAMVGARNASAAAMKLARQWAHELAAQGWVVVSGLARGIDGAAHEGALQAIAALPGGFGAGSGGGLGGGLGGGTIGVIAGGIDLAYPPQHGPLQERIAEEGLLLAEQAPGTEPRGSHFPSRNRIIAGLCAGTLVVEAAPRSGSLITARLAAEAGREVMAVPGSPLDARSQGCNQLIRDGAVLVQRPEEAIELLCGFHGAPAFRLREEGEGHALAQARPAKGEAGDAGEEALAAGEVMVAAEEEECAARIAGLLSSAPVDLAELIRQSGARQGAVQLALLELEIAGNLVRHAGGRVSLAQGAMDNG